MLLYRYPKIIGNQSNSMDLCFFYAPIFPVTTFAGNIGVAQKGADPTNSIPPGIWGGNFDNRRFVVPSTLHSDLIGPANLLAFFILQVLLVSEFESQLPLRNCNIDQGSACSK
jgi:hypothetical protein